MNHANILKNAALLSVASIGGVVSYLFGGWDGMMVALIAVMSVDYLSGLAVALIWHTSNKTKSGAASSGAAVKGIIKKVMCLLGVLVAAQLTPIVGSDIVRDAVILYFIGAEGLSILENGGQMGIQYPKALKNALEALREKGDGNNGASGH